MEKPQWPVRSREYVVQSKYLRLRRDEVEIPGAGLSDFYVRESEGFVIVFALTPARHVVMVHQYRYGIDRITLELPAGTIESNEHPLLCAKRELAEETGYSARRWEELVTSPSDPVRSPSIMHAYLAFDAEQSEEPHPDEGEIVETELLPIDETIERARRGEIGSVPSLAVIYAALDRLSRG